MLRKFLFQAVLIYVFVHAMVLLLANRTIFVPPNSTYSDFDKIIKLSTADGKKISAFYLYNPKAKYTVIYSHGNAADLGMILPILELWYSWGFSIIGYDYHGYGTSEGKPSEKATYMDIKAVYDFLTQQQKINPKQIILFGSSVGSGPTIDLATHSPVAGIILEGAFISAYRVITYFPIFFFDKYQNLAKLNSIHVPILFIHGTLDFTIPIWHGRKLYASYNGPKDFYWVPNVGHNDIDFGSKEYKDKIFNFVDSLKQ